VGGVKLVTGPAPGRALATLALVVSGLALTTGPATADTSVSIVDLDFNPRTASVAAGTTLS